MKTYNHLRVFNTREEFTMSIGGQSEASQARSEQKIYRLTPDGYAKKQERLEYLRTVKRKEIVETYEADPKSGLISDQSPVGKSLMGHQEGDSVSVATPGGVTNYTIRSIRPML